MPPTPRGVSLTGETLATVVDRDVLDVVVSLRGGYRVAGHVTIDGGTPSATDDTLRRIGVAISPGDGRDFGPMPLSSIDVDNTFTSVELPAGVYALSLINMPAGLYLRSVTRGPQDLTTVGISLESGGLASVHVDLTRQPVPVSGSVRDSVGRAVSGACVLLFPQESVGWTDFGGRPVRLQSTTTDVKGSYRFGHVPPGKYFSVAVRDLFAELSWMRPSFLKAAAGVGTRVDVGEGGIVQDLKVVQVVER